MAGKGGARPGSGRKSNATKLVEAGFVCNYWGALEQEKFWKSMLACEDDRIKLDAGKYLTDRLYGKASQAVALSDPDGDKLEFVVRHIGRAARS